MANISEFINNFNGGLRANRFIIKSEGYIFGSHEIHVAASSIPQMQIVNLPINFKGKAINYPGSRGFVPWTFTVRDDTKGGLLHRNFINWSNSIISTGEHFGVVLPNLQSQIWTVMQLADTNTQGGAEIIRTFKLKKCWPMEISPLALDMSQDAALSSFQVQLAYIEME